MIEHAVIIANGDLRLAANQNAWPTQHAVEKLVSRALSARGVQVTRGHDWDPSLRHGFIDSQRRGLEVFRRLDPRRPLVVVLSTWQYSHHILHGLLTHEAPILTVANFNGRWPGLVGMLNLNASLKKAGVPYSTLWSDTFEDDFFRESLDTWIQAGRLEHDESHVREPTGEDKATDAWVEGAQIGAELRRRKSIIGVFDEGCMGMFNAIIPDSLLHAAGVFKERLSQSALYHATMQVADADAHACRRWLDDEGMTFSTGQDPATELTDDQIQLQLKMYIAALRIADEFGCDAIGIQYQQGLKDLLPASDLAEGLINSTSRPPVTTADGSRVLFEGRAFPHFNEVDECSGLDALVTHAVWRSIGLDPATTLHDVRWGDVWRDDFVWVFEISGAAPVEHFRDGYEGTSSMRQPPMYFRLGGGTMRGVCRSGHIVWSRVFVNENRLEADLGLGTVHDLPAEETERRWRATNYEWPIMHAVLTGVSRDQMMARHASNHVQVAYADGEDGAMRALLAKAGAFESMGIRVHFCGFAK